MRITGPIQPAWDALVDQARRHPRPDGFVFPQYVTWARKGMDRLCRLAFGALDEQGNLIEDRQKLWTGKPVKHGHPHMLRHSFASMALMHWRPAWPAEILAKWLGHRDINTTFKLYAHWMPTEAPSGYDYRHKSATSPQNPMPSRMESGR